MLQIYPVCATWASGENPSQMAAVDAKGSPLASSAAEVIASVSVTFGMAVWLSLVIHAFGVEVYVSLAPSGMS